MAETTAKCSACGSTEFTFQEVFGPPAVKKTCDQVRSQIEDACSNVKTLCHQHALKNQELEKKYADQCVSLAAAERKAIAAQNELKQQLAPLIAEARKRAAARYDAMGREDPSIYADGTLEERLVAEETAKVLADHPNRGDSPAEIRRQRERLKGQVAERVKRFETTALRS